MGTVVVGIVTVGDDGAITYNPADPNNSFAGRHFVAELANVDAFTVANDGEVPPNAERVPTLRYYAGRSNALAAALVPLINAGTADP